MSANVTQSTLDLALTHVESESIRQWVKSERNLPVWESFVTRNPAIDPIRLATLIVSHAIGL